MSHVVHEGWAHKQNKLVSSWRPRYLTLYNDGKLYYNVKPGGRHKGGFAITANSEIVSPGECITRPSWPNNPPTWSREVMLDNAFAIITPTRNFYFYCKDPEDTSAWLHHLREIHTKIAEQAGDTSKLQTDVLPFEEEDDEEEEEEAAAPDDAKGDSKTPSRRSSFFRKLSISRRNSSSSGLPRSNSISQDELKAPNLDSIPLLSNEQQLKIMMLVKEGMSVDEALIAAQKAHAEPVPEEAEDVEGGAGVANAGDAEPASDMIVEESTMSKETTFPVQDEPPRVLVPAQLERTDLLQASVQTPFVQIMDVCRFAGNKNGLAISYTKVFKGETQYEVKCDLDDLKALDFDIDLQVTLDPSPIDHEGINFAGRLSVKRAAVDSEGTIYLPGTRSYDPAGKTGDDIACERVGKGDAEIISIFVAAAVAALRHKATREHIAKLEEAFKPVVEKNFGRTTLLEFMTHQLINACVEHSPKPASYANFLEVMQTVGKLNTAVTEREHCNLFLKSLWEGSPKPPFQYYRAQKATEGIDGVVADNDKEEFERRCVAEGEFTADDDLARALAETLSTHNDTAVEAFEAVDDSEDEETQGKAESTQPSSSLDSTDKNEDVTAQDDADEGATAADDSSTERGSNPFGESRATSDANNEASTPTEPTAAEDAIESNSHSAEESNVQDDDAATKTELNSDDSAKPGEQATSSTESSADAGADTDAVELGQDSYSETPNEA